MADITVDEIKNKFQTLQKMTQSLKEEKIRYESELSTLQTQHDEKVKALLEATNTESLEEAVKFCKKKKEELDKLKSELDSELSKYIDESGEAGEDNSEGTTDDGFGDFFG